MPNASNRRYTWTCNNPTEDDLTNLRELGENPLTKYHIFGHEIAPTTGTPHYQGYTIFTNAIRFNRATRLLRNCHVAVSRGTSQENIAYCKKDGNAEEWGRGPAQGERNDLKAFIEYAKNLETLPSEAEIALEFPEVWINHPRMVQFCSIAVGRPNLVDAAPRPGWQTHLARRLAVPDADPREVMFYVDEEGNSGKSWMTKWILTNYAKSQLLPVGKEADVGYMIDETNSIFIFDVPRSKMQFLNYATLENLKDRLVHSPKYLSRIKLIRKVPHVVVFCNEFPDETKLSADRYSITVVNDVNDI